MVIVDVRSETVGIPTDAYFGVEEIKDVRFFGRVLLFDQIFTANTPVLVHIYRMAQRHKKRSSTFPPQSKACRIGSRRPRNES